MSEQSEHAVTGTPGAIDPRTVQPDATQAEELPTIPRAPVYSQTAGDPDPAGDADLDPDQATADSTEDQP